MPNQPFRHGYDRHQQNKDSRQNERQHPQNMSEAREYLENNIREILRMSKSDYAKEIISKTSEFVKHGCVQLKTHQIRNIYGVVKRHHEVSAIQAVARPHIVNIAGKQVDPTAKQAVELFEKILEAVENKEEVAECQLFFEAVVCYHKYHHGDKNK